MLVRIYKGIIIQGCLWWSIHNMQLIIEARGFFPLKRRCGQFAGTCEGEMVMSFLWLALRP